MTDPVELYLQRDTLLRAGVAAEHLISSVDGAFKKKGALWRHLASAISVLTVSIPIVSPTSGQQSWAIPYAHPLPRSPRTSPSPSIHQREVCASGATRCLSRRL